MPDASSRMFFLDNLRSVIILLVVVLHSSLVYMAYAPEWWYVLDTQKSIVFTMIVLILDVPIMMAMFFLAGYFAYPSLSKRGSGLFLKDKFKRIGFPWILGVFLLAPPTTYITLYSRNIDVSFFHFLTHEFWQKMFQQSVYWFLGVLFLFFIILSFVYKFSASFRMMKRVSGRPSYLFFILFILFNSCCFLSLNKFFSLDTWFSDAYIFIFQPNRAPLYITYFILGLYAFQKKWFINGEFSPNIFVWGAVCLISGYLYLNYRLTIPASAQNTLLLKAGNALLFNCFCLSALMTLIVLMKKIANSSGIIWKSLSDNSYGIYFVHPLILYPFAYLIRPLTMPLFIKSLTVMAGGILMSWVVAAVILRKIPVIRNSF